jgi:hypothetical protein
MASRAVTALNARAEWESAWDEFASRTDQITAVVMDLAARGDPVHDLLRSLYAVPYWKSKRLVLADDAAISRNNPGSVTGLFFERFMGAAVIGFVKARLPGARFAIGRHAEGYYPVGLPRDPDMSVEHNGRLALFEFKASPKKRDLEAAERLKATCDALGVSFYLCGGEVVGRRGLIGDITAANWAAFLEARASNSDIIATATVDRILADAVARLDGATV